MGPGAERACSRRVELWGSPPWGHGDALFGALEMLCLGPGGCLACGHGGVLSGAAGMPSAGPWGCPAWGHAPAGRQAAGRGRCAAGSQQAVLLLPRARRCPRVKASSRAGPWPRQLPARGAARAARRRMLSRPHRCAEPSRSGAQPLPGPAAPALRARQAQQLVPAVTAAGQSIFPRGRAAHICSSASQPPPAFPARVTATARPSRRAPVPR